jgi:SNF2 family DNA or RNA helicase
MLHDQSILLGEASKPGGSLLAQIQNLRTLSSHANKDDGSFENSPKFTYLKDLLWEVLSSGEKALVFTSFNLTAERLAKWLAAGWPDIYINSINGSTPVDDRQKIVDEFSEFGRGVLILNPQAAGVGLNITAANHVVHFNPEWNPALTEQASKRAHRNGQTRPVTVHYLFYTQTVEELVASSQDMKRAIGKALVPGVLLPLSESDVIKRLISWGPR